MLFAPDVWDAGLSRASQRPTGTDVPARGDRASYHAFPALSLRPSSRQPKYVLAPSTNGMYFPTETLLIGPKLERTARRHAEEES